MQVDKLSGHLVVFEPSGRRGRVPHNATLLDAARELGEDIESVCGGKLVCGKCIIQIDKVLSARHGIKSAGKSLSSPTKKELSVLKARGLDNSFRLACHARVLGDVAVFVPETSRMAKQVIRKASIKRPVKLKPAVRKYYVEVPPGSLKDPLGDADRLTARLNREFGLANLKIDYDVLGSLPPILYESGGKVTATVWMDQRVVRVQAGFIERSYGVALDIGTTTVAAYLCDLSTGDTLATAADINPQISFGDDVISRITYAMSDLDGLGKLNHEIISCIGNLLADLVKKAGILPGNISEIVVVGNTAMHHIFLNIDPSGLGRSPFTPLISSSLNVDSDSLGLGHGKSLNVHTLPIIAGFVGADTVGVLIAEEPYKQDKMALIIDIGTNGELVFGNKKKLLCASCAMGPAFEGGNIKFGMRAAPGAIEKVEIDGKTLDLRFKVIGSDKWNTQSCAVKARGICGSGIIDALAEMVRTGIIEQGGRFNKNLSSDRLVANKEGPAFILARADETATGKDITIDINDVRSVQLAKAAMYAGARILMDKLKIGKPDKVVLAGAFGSYINKENALAIGLFPGCELKNVYSVGNAAGEGARLALLNIDKRREADDIARRIEYIELTTEPDFQKHFVKALQFPASNICRSK
ncbi:MAG: ASKHA domain-containing protein [Chloroflexi bacterium]|nr:ASKHA domain-containing protein [Chloroflexota bacterium]